MKGIVYAGEREVVVKDFPDPAAGAGEVLVRMKAAGICGSDMHAYRSAERRKAWGLSSQRIPGHEPCGVVEEVGAGVTSVKPGDRVVVYHIAGCGHCRYCLKGEVMYCSVDRRIFGSDINGSMADFVVAPERNCLPLPQELSYVEGALLACIGGTTYKNLKLLDVSGKDTVGIFGLGPVGGAAVMMAKGRGARVIGVDLLPVRIALAKEVGADEVINFDEREPVAAIRELTNGEGADVCVDTSGNPVGQNNALNATRILGRVGMIGVNTGETTIRTSDQILSPSRTIRGSWIYGLEDYHDMVEFVVGRDIKLEKLVTHRFPIEQAPEAFQLFDSGKTGKVVFVWD